MLQVVAIHLPVLFSLEDMWSSLTKGKNKDNRYVLVRLQTGNVQEVQSSDEDSIPVVKLMTGPTILPMLKLPTDKTISPTRVNTTNKLNWKWSDQEDNDCPSSFAKKK